MAGEMKRFTPLRNMTMGFLLGSAPLMQDKVELQYTAIRAERNTNIHKQNDPSPFLTCDSSQSKLDSVIFHFPSLWIRHTDKNQQAKKIQIL